MSLELFDGIPVIDEDLDADYGPNDIDACLGLADLELRRVLRLIDVDKKTGKFKLSRKVLLPRTEKPATNA